MRWLAVVLGLWLSLLCGSAAYALATVVVVTSEDGPAYREASEALAHELERRGLSRREVVTLTADHLARTESQSPRLYVALGVAAATQLARTSPQVPVLCALIPRLGFDAVLAASGRKSSSQFTALYLSQPHDRQLRLARLALPGLRRVGVLWGPQSHVQAKALRDVARAMDLELIEGTVASADALYPPLRSVLDSAQLLLAVPDPVVFNSLSIQNILLSAYRARIPMAGFSEGYTRAGALFSLYVTPAQVGAQAAELASQYLQGRPLPASPVYGQDFWVAVNEPVARSLGLELDARSLRSELLRLEKKS